MIGLDRVTRAAGLSQEDDEMDANASTSLPWDALRNTEGEIPWTALEQFTEAAAADGDVLEELLDLYGDFQEAAYERHSFECLYVPAILAMAAPRLSDAGRNRAARFLLRSLILAGDEDDELMEEVLPAAIGAFGPKVVLPLVVEFMPADYKPWNATFGIWQMAKLARNTNDPELREPIVKLCTEALEKAERGLLDITDVDYAGFVLARIGHLASRPLIQRLYDKTELGDLNDYLELFDGKWVLPPDEDVWDKPIAKWLEENWEFLRDWYQEDHNADDDGEETSEEDQDEATERRAQKLSQEFAQSLGHLPLSRDSREDAESIAHFLLDYAWTYEGAKPEDLTIPVLREVLLEWFPRKISADREFYELTGSVVEAFLHWLGTKGILKDETPLENAVHQWREEIVARGTDPKCWGMAKGFAMAAKERGIDLGDKDAMNRFIGEHNGQINQPGRYEPAEESFEPVAAPIVNDGAKVGRNEPCPCGSGKKFKKCCGR
jgi:hypothetical protein